MKRRDLLAAAASGAAAIVGGGLAKAETQPAEIGADMRLIVIGWSTEQSPTNIIHARATLAVDGIFSFAQAAELTGKRVKLVVCE